MRHEKTVSVSKIRHLWEPCLDLCVCFFLLVSMQIKGKRLEPTLPWSSQNLAHVNFFLVLVQIGHTFRPKIIKIGIDCLI